MKDAYIVSPLRTPIGKFGGVLASLTAVDLAVKVIQSIVEKTGLDTSTLDEVIIAQSYSSSEAPCIGRYAALAAGLPIEVPGYTLDRRCGSGLQAIINAAMTIQSGNAEAIMVVGVESMSNIEYYSTNMRWGSRAGNVTFFDRLERGRERSQPIERFGAISGMPETADNLARDYNIGREECDAFALQSHQKAQQAWDTGKFKEEVIPLEVKSKKESKIIDFDEGIRANSTIESLAKLKTLLPNGVTTAGNSSQQNDAAAGCLIVSKEYLEKYHLQPIAKITGWSAAGCDPSRMGIGPVPAVNQLLKKLDISLEEIDLVEINEAFAAQALAVIKGLNISDTSNINVNGSGISLGHPIGATGIRIMTSLVHEMKRRNARYGLETMCIGGGQGLAALFERV
ncbi:acetyl-CoA C-acetyltransferase [Acinetobacter lwoffii]|uniref:Beta-ketoadipyl-CoA thiolase n=1 Tax=Acinetobacter lwoffii TaxID=28090 RepID=A0AAJ4P2Q9_ACILW|nr:MULTISPECIES: acetyl-CoA C-acetyltransferase [Acinetobacter]MCO8088995.1 acetyl-CoA C-acetyltransferase [Acinetobacter indicus]MDP1370787.1 acetyl-CoA C-acetyltransferase [Acinetobacter lwoffii]MDP1390193.1 acetyl-CoA C-acetyltransferase [Acinetobacter lwoffii]MDP1447825.1 acetyl-CoA C-acetyltransferase [Acinetobacter lwoffii]QXR06803.1 acetyl-CoA C-acetyltransferase [Acinetobacter lwoffii]